MVSYSSILAWKIPWIEEPGGLQSMGPQTVGHDWATNTHTHTHTYTHIWRSEGEPELESKINPIWYFSTIYRDKGKTEEGGGETSERNQREATTYAWYLWPWNLGAFVDSFPFYFIPVFIRSSKGKKKKSYRKLVIEQRKFHNAHRLYFRRLTNQSWASWEMECDFCYNSCALV